MECSICGVRGSIGFCVACQALLCEECGVVCEQCGKLACPDHVHKSRRGRNLCAKCWEEREARRAERDAGAVKARETPEGEEEGEEALDEVVLVESARRAPPPWRLSVYTACLGASMLVLLLLVPGLRGIGVPGGWYVPTPYVLLIIPAFAVFWAVVGLVGKTYQADWTRSLLGLGIALIVAVLMVIAVFTDPARRAALEAQKALEVRETMSPEELQQWRENVLDRFRR